MLALRTNLLKLDLVIHWYPQWLLQCTLHSGILRNVCVYFTYVLCFYGRHFSRNWLNGRMICFKWICMQSSGQRRSEWNFSSRVFHGGIDILRFFKGGQPSPFASRSLSCVGGVKTEEQKSGRQNLHDILCC